MVLAFVHMYSSYQKTKKKKNLGFLSHTTEMHNKPWSNVIVKSKSTLHNLCPICILSDTIIIMHLNTEYTCEIWISVFSMFKFSIIKWLVHTKINKNSYHSSNCKICCEICCVYYVVLNKFYLSYILYFTLYHS